MMRLEHHTDVGPIFLTTARVPACTFILLVAVIFFKVLPPHALAEDPLKSPYRIRFGTLEINADRARNYIFRWDGQEEIFDTSIRAILSASGPNFPGLPDLKEIGFKTASGKVFKYEGTPPDVFIKKFSEDHPDEVYAALIFQGYLDQDLEIQLEGRTPVCRVDIIRNSDNTALWKNMPGQPSEKFKKEPNK